MSGLATNEEALEELRQIFLTKIPFNGVLGIEIPSLTAGAVEFNVPYRAELIGDPSRPALHGGVISAVADTAGGCAVWSMVGLEGRVSTIDLRVDYLRPGKPEALRCRGEVLRLGNRVGVAQIVLYQDSDPDAVVAEAKGVYSIRRAEG